MRKKTVYKFRPLGNQLDFQRAKAILETGHFWCSRYTELNDPMEGVYFIKKPDIMRDALSEKLGYMICSFSGQTAFKFPPMWGYYANGFKGLAFEIEVEEGMLKKIDYKKNVNALEDIMGIPEVLCTKLRPWVRENEFRFLRESKKNLHEIGTIQRLHFGDPHGNVRNRDDVIRKIPDMKSYINRRNELRNIAEDLGVSCNLVEIKSHKVVPNNDITDWPRITIKLKIRKN